MASTISAKKRIRQNVKCRSLNRWRKRRIHLAIRDFEGTLHGTSTDEAMKAFRTACSMLDKVATKGAIHKNNASRRKGRLAKRLNGFVTASA